METTNQEINPQDMRFMEMAAQIAEDNVDRGGGPFGAVIVRNGEVIATGANSVTLTSDPRAQPVLPALPDVSVSTLLGRSKPHLLRQHSGRRRCH